MGDLIPVPAAFNNEAHEEKITKITKKRKGVRFQHAIQQCCYQTHVSVKYAKKNAGEGV